MTDARVPPPPLITRWATQAGREPAALSRARAQLDARGFADLLSEAAHLAGLVGFQEAERLIGGDWRSVLAADPTMVLALLATIDLEGRSEGLQALLDHARENASAIEAEQLLGRLLEGLLRFAAELDEWLAPAAVGEALEGHAAHRLIEASIEEVLAPLLRGLLAEVAAAVTAGLLRDIVPHHHRLRLRPQWRLGEVEEEVAALRDEVERIWVDRLLDRIARVAEAFVHEMREIGERSAAALDSSLASGRHPPHVALVLAFAKIFRHAQERLNDVPQRLVRFYQEEVLRDAPRGAAADSLFLTIEPRPGARPRIPKGTLFAAGEDAAGVPVAFAADCALDATGARLAGVRLWTPVRGADGRIARVRAAIFAVGADGTIGEGESGIAAPGTRVAVAPAAVFAAPALRLAAGTRRIELRLACSPLSNTITAMAGASLRMAVSTAQGWLDLGASGVAVHCKAVADAISICALLPPEMPPIEPCPAGTPDAPAEAAIRLTLRQEAAGTFAPWEAFSRIVLAGATLAVAVKDAGDLVVSTPSGLASAEGAAPFGSPPIPGGWLRIDHLMLARPLDRLLLRLDWAGLPAGRTGFAGYYREYAVDLDRRLRDYPLFTNLSFTVTMAAPVPGWDATRRLPLFAPAGPGATPAVAAPPPDIFEPGERFGAAAAAEPAPHGPLALASWFAAAASDAPAGPIPDHLFVTLATPQEGFGDAIYPANVAHATQLLGGMESPTRRRGLLRRIWDGLVALVKKAAAKLIKVVKTALALLLTIVKAPARLIDKAEGFSGGYIEDWYDEPQAEAEAEPEPDPGASAILPNPPFRPLLSRIRLDYACSLADGDGADALKLWHAMPLEGLRRCAAVADAPLFAPLPERLSIDLALADARPGEPQSLLVRLGPAPGEGDEARPAPAYSYHGAGGWRPLPLGMIRSDGTAGFSRTGIIVVALPVDAAPIEGGDGLWLRILPFGEAPPPIIAVTPDALSATRILADGAAPLEPLPPATIVKLPEVAGIARVAQPLASAGGRPAETPAMLRRRVAERVRHRGRGVAAWDLERLVLAEFPGIAKVRAFAAGDPAAESPSGNVTLVVVPGPGGADPPDPDRPRAPPQLRGGIARRLEAMMSPFARVQVVDPAYLPIGVEAHIQVDDESTAGRVKAALAALLSPWAEPGLDLDDQADQETIRAAIAAFLLAQPGVAAIDRLSVTLGGATPPGVWRLPVAGRIELVGIAAERTALSW